MVHVSTAYANCHLQETYEELYPAPIKPDRLISMVDWLKDKPDVVTSMTTSLVQPRPNTYTYTKAVAEHILVEDAGDTVPYSIIRPSIGKYPCAEFRCETVRRKKEMLVSVRLGQIRLVRFFLRRTVSRRKTLEP